MDNIILTGMPSCGKSTLGRMLAKDLGYDFTYTKSPGDHSWPCWDEQIRNVLDWLPLRLGFPP